MRRFDFDLKTPWSTLAIFGTVGLILFDTARKTIFLGANWNYEYPAWEFIYDPFALGALIIASGMLVVSFDRIMDLERNHYVIVLFVSTVVISALAFFATPEKSFKWALTPDTPGPVESFQYQPATIAAEEGLQSFFAQFHSASTLSGSDRLETTRYLTEQLREAEYLPWNDSMADYASKIVTQRHGPIPGLLVAPFLVVLGSSPENAVIGSYAITITFPLLTYFLLRPYFGERRSRLGSLFVLFAPAYLIYQRYGTISYDAITAVVATVAVILFLNACRTDRRWVLAVSGIVFSGAMLSKISILTLFAAFGVLILVYTDTVKEAVSDILTFGGSTLIVPITLLFLGYNFVIQYLYDIARILMSGNAASGSPVFAWLISVYNIRLLGPVVLVFAVLFVYILVVDRNRCKFSERDYISIAFLLPVVPFLALRGITLSRHLLPLLPLIVFVGLWGKERLTDRKLSSVEIKIALGVTIGLTLINL